MNIEKIELILNTGSRYITNDEKAHIIDYIEYLKSKNNIVESKNIELVIENERLNNIPNKIKEYLKQVHIETQNGILSSNNLIWENIERLCDGKDIIGSDKE